jgi:DNA-binding response OmpR family regulator
MSSVGQAAPRARRPREAPQNETPARRAEGQQERNGHVRILVVEDDEDARNALAQLLELTGYDVLVASDGDEALSLLDDELPDLVVTDWRMPGLSGQGFCVALREKSETLPIIVVTSADEVFDRDQPVNARLRKPIDPPVLQSVIRDALRCPRPERPITIR